MDSQDLSDGDLDSISLVKSYNGNQAIHLAVMHGNAHMLETLASQPKYINIKNRDGKTALHLACLRNNFAAVEILLRHGADPNITDNNNETAIFSAMENYSGDNNIINMLIAYNAKINSTEHDKNTPLHIALSFSLYDLARIFIYNPEVKINQQNSSRQTPLDLFLSAINFSNNQQANIPQEQLKILTILIQKGAISNQSTEPEIKKLENLKKLLLIQDKNKNPQNSQNQPNPEEPDADDCLII